MDGQARVIAEFGRGRVMQRQLELGIGQFQFRHRTFNQG